MRLHKMESKSSYEDLPLQSHREDSSSHLASDAGSLTDAPAVIAKTFEDSQGSHSEEMFEELVDNGVFVDLLSVVRNSMQVGYQSMSLKYMERLTGFKRRSTQLRTLKV